MKIQISAFSGKARSGKTTAARYVAKKLDKAVVMAFADPIKEIALSHFGYAVTRADMLGDKKRIISIGGRKITVRQLLIEIGTKYREIDPDFWVKRFLGKIKKLRGVKHILVDDMRYPNEFAALSELDSKMIRINRKGIKLIDDASEKMLDNYKFDAYFENDGTLLEYYVKLHDGLISRQKKRKPRHRR